MVNKYAGIFYAISYIWEISQRDFGQHQCDDKNT